MTTIEKSDWAERQSRHQVMAWLASFGPICLGAAFAQLFGSRNSEAAGWVLFVVSLAASISICVYAASVKTDPDEAVSTKDLLRLPEDVTRELVASGPSGVFTVFDVAMAYHRVQIGLAKERMKTVAAEQQMVLAKPNQAQHHQHQSAPSADSGYGC